MQPVSKGSLGGDGAVTPGQDPLGKSCDMSKSVSCKRHRFPPQINADAVWLYFRFPLSVRLVEETLPERGIVVSFETVRRWAKKFGPEYARRLRRKRPRPKRTLGIWTRS